MNRNTPFSSPLISPDELHRALTTPQNLRIILIAAGRQSALQSYESKHIPGSVFFNMDVARDAGAKYPLMLPTPRQFSDYTHELNIRSDDVLVVYDTFETGLYFAPRVAWACQHFGHKEVYVLNNFARYVQGGFPVSNGPLLLPERLSTSVEYPETSSINMKEVVSFDEMCDIINNQGLEERYQIIDARPADRFSGSYKGPDGPLPSGHMPNSINIPFSSILSPEKAILPPTDLKALFAMAGVQEHIPIVLSCNSGTTATGIYWALRTCGIEVETRLYDGSWFEWVDKADEGMIVIE
ncbi:Rhodanese-like protein [Penicillium angulare]|uniref:Rhodanese-like protein n=1 Tax=Penicillium angulare TaxID=116970 RepID=UPI002541CCE2|nr:Rhodanese-like protein [Penicillium angulare]KAJ5257096.1 Rhodanese-like protein [Penicillium angulare]